jgi:glycosyltransferase involved in cell wall biosynthesis
MTDCLRVVFIITGLKTGGAEMMLEKLLGALPTALRAHVISLTDLGEVGPRLLARGVPVEALGLRPGLPNPLVFMRLVRRLSELRPDVVHTWMYHADLLGGLAARLAGVRAVMWGLRQSNLDPALNRASTLRVMHLCARLSRSVPARIACAAGPARDAHVAAGYDAGRMVVIPNGFQLDRFRSDAAMRGPVRAELGLGEDVPLVGLVGRFDPQKNHRGFAEAMAGLHALAPRAHAVLVGAGVDGSNGELRAWLAQAGIAGRCHLLGRRDDMPRLMAALDVLALPSLGEAFPNAVGEAMACGVPCVVTDVGDAADIVGGTGEVVRSGDMPGFARALARVLALQEADRQALGVAAQARIRERYDIQVVARLYETHYRALAAASPIAARA